jgi:hypothetical protein
MGLTLLLCEHVERLAGRPAVRGARAEVRRAPPVALFALEPRPFERVFAEPRPDLA